MNQGFDLSSVLNKAATETQNAENSGGSNNGPKLIYPQQGTIQVRLLFNPASGLVMRKYEQHKVGDSKVACLQMYGKECPVCKIINDINNAKGTDLWKNKRTTRGIAYAEYVASDYKWEKPEDAPKAGDVVILMFPWSVYTDLNRIISSAGQNIYSLVASNIGGVIKISRFTENKQVKYKAEIDAFNMQHQTRPTDDEYNKLLTEQVSLNEKFMPAEFSEDILVKAKELADQLNREYLSPVNVQPHVGTAGTNLGGVGLPNQSAPVMTPPPVANPYANDPTYYQDPTSGQWFHYENGQWVAIAPPMPATPPTPPTPPMTPPVQTPPAQQFTPQVNNAPVNTPPVQTAPVSDPSKPQCYGQHGSPSVNANNCLLCPHEAQCQTAVAR